MDIFKFKYPGEVKYDSFDISAHPKNIGEKDKFKYEWDKFNLWPLVMKNDESVHEAYSMASYPAEEENNVKCWDCYSTLG